MKLSGAAVPLRQPRERLRRPSVLVILATARVSELSMTHKVGALVVVERAAFFAARSQRADVSMQGTGA